VDLTEVKKFESQIVTRKLSDAIRIGCATTLPTKELGKQHWITERSGNCYACVIGAAWIGAGLGFRSYEHIGRIGGEWLTEHFGIPRNVATDVHLDYEYGGKSREQIADWLEAQGY
jgi:hypothetical protein